MNKLEINIQAQTILGKSYSKIFISPVSYALNGSNVTVPYEFCDVDGFPEIKGRVIIQPVSNWGTDDNVIVNATLAALGLTAA